MKIARGFFITVAAVMLAITLTLFLYIDHTHVPLTLHAAPTIQSQTDRLDINTATDLQLQTLPGIGPKLSKAIIAYRAQNGSFQSVADLLNVPGIGTGKLEAIVDLITIGG